MPAVAMFYGIIVYLHSERGSKHHRPHLHARCGDGRVAVYFDGEVLAGSFPAKKLALLRAWIVLHREELEADWLLASSGQAVFRIEPLR